MTALPESLKGEYDQRTAARSPTLTTARECAKYTLPWLVPPAGANQGRSRRRRYSNFGARCVNSLASKLLLAMFPARHAFFKYEVDAKALAAMGGDPVKGEVDAALSGIEQAIQADIDGTPTRAPAGVALRHLLVAGNILVHMLPEGGLKNFPIQSYVCWRDGSGNALGMIAVEELAPETLPPAFREMVELKMKDRECKDKTTQLYTGIIRQDSEWVIWQEVEGIMVPESKGKYPLDACPWLALRWTPVEGSDYGRSMVEDYLDDIVSVEGLQAATVKGTAAAAKLIYLRNPNSTTKAASITQSETGDVINGKAEDITVLQSEKRADFQTAREQIRDLKEELSYAFALNQAVQRSAERVTAEEIRFMAQELDSTLGGHYSALSIEFQRPFLVVKQLQMAKDGRLPKLPKEGLKLVIVTGLDALGRSADLDNLKGLVKDLVDLGGPDALKTWVNFGGLIQQLATARGIQTTGLINTPDQVAAQNQQAQLMEMVQQLGPNAINQAGQLAGKRMEQAAPVQ